jgi:hypothetical protein
MSERVARQLGSNAQSSLTSASLLLLLLLLLLLYVCVCVCCCCCSTGCACRVVLAGGPGWAQGGGRDAAVCAQQRRAGCGAGAAHQRRGAAAGQRIDAGCGAEPCGWLQAQPGELGVVLVGVLGCGAQARLCGMAGSMAAAWWHSCRSLCCAAAASAACCCTTPTGLLPWRKQQRRAAAAAAVVERAAVRFPNAADVHHVPAARQPALAAAVPPARLCLLRGGPRGRGQRDAVRHALRHTRAPRHRAHRPAHQLAPAAARGGAARGRAAGVRQQLPRGGAGGPGGRGHLWHPAGALPAWCALVCVGVAARGSCCWRVHTACSVGL